MKDELLKLNLQLFNDMEDDDYIDEDYLDEDDTEIDEEEIDEETDEEYLDEETDEEEDDETNVDSEVKSDKKVPILALQKEREKFRKREEEYNKKLQELEKKAIIAEKLKLADESLMDITDDELIKNLEYSQAQKYIKAGISEQEAFEIIRNNEEVKKMKAKMKDIELKEEIAELTKNPLFANIVDYKDEVVNYAKTRGLTLEQAYFAVLGSSVVQDRLKELERAKKHSKNKTIIDTNTSNTNTANVKSNGIKLDAETRKLIKDFGYTEKDAIKLMKEKRLI